MTAKFLIATELIFVVANHHTNGYSWYSFWISLLFDILLSHMEFEFSAHSKGCVFMMIDLSKLFCHCDIVPCVLDVNNFRMSTSQDRQVSFQDSINKKVLLEWVRITGLENPHKRPFDKILSDFSINVLKYPKEKPSAFSWPTAAGVSKGITAIRTKISYDFWRFFLSEGRTNLAEYNSSNHKEIRISREQTLKVSDNERLALYIGKFIRDVHSNARRKCPEIIYKKGILHIGKEYALTPTMAAYKFDINLDEWNGLPLEDLYTPSEKESIEKGEVRGSLRLTGVNLTRPIHREEREGNEEGPDRKRPRCDDLEPSTSAASASNGN